MLISGKNERLFSTVPCFFYICTVKKWFAYTLLFALTLLLVPRSWVHDCDHDHIESEGSDGDHEHCFVCELDLDTGTFNCVPSFTFYPNEVLKPVLQDTESLPLPAFNLYDHRGPPFSC